LQPLQILDLPVADLYSSHWSITGVHVPEASTTDEAVFLPGRNILLLAKAVIWCHLHGIEAVALATLRSNPFPDATPEFFDSYQRLLNRALGSQVGILRPYALLSKKAVMERGRHLPLQWTFSCLSPVSLRHCGRCNKCAERMAAYAEAGMADATEYQKE
jgi:7-cyano-7-deazaguanine synthase